MHQSIEEVVDELKKKYKGLSRVELERMFNTPYRALEDHIRSKDIRTLNMMYLGKFKLSKFYINKLKQDELLKEAKGDTGGLEERPDNSESRDTGNGI